MPSTVSLSSCLLATRLIITFASRIVYQRMHSPNPLLVALSSHQGVRREEPKPLKALDCRACKLLRRYGYRAKCR